MTATPEQQRIHDAAAALYTALRAVPDSTVDYRVENARQLTMTLMRVFDEIVTADVKQAQTVEQQDAHAQERAAIDAAKVVILAAEAKYNEALAAFDNAESNADSKVAYDALVEARIVLDRARGVS